MDAAAAADGDDIAADTAVERDLLLPDEALDDRSFWTARLLKPLNTSLGASNADDDGLPEEEEDGLTDASPAAWIRALERATHFGERAAVPLAEAACSLEWRKLISHPAVSVGCDRATRTRDTSLLNHSQRKV